MQVHLLEAQTGDAFIVDCGDSRIIIDGGTRGVAKSIRRKLQNNVGQELKAIIVSHVDNDHVGGIVKMFQHHSSLIPKHVPIYINHPSLVPVKEDKSGLVSFDDGNTLKTLLDDKGYCVRQASEDDVIKLGSIELKILTPSIEDRTSLYKEWLKSDKDSGLVSSDLIEVDYLAMFKEPKPHVQSDIVNIASTSFILEHQEKRVLFLSDSDSNSIETKLKKKTKFDLVKVSHHGSKNNTSLKMLEKIECNNFIVSTNGPRSYGHPHAESLVRLIKSCEAHGFGECNLYFNYKKVKDRIRLKNIPEKIKVNLIHTNFLSL